MRVALCTVALMLAAVSEAAAAPCPEGAIRVPPGQSLATAVAQAVPGAAFCIGSGVHRGQSVQPRTGQRFFGEPGAVLNGAMPVTSFLHLGDIWIAGGLTQNGVERGVCAAGYEACALSLGVFIDGQPLRQAAARAALKPGSFFFDRRKREIILADAPDGRRVEASFARFAFHGPAEDVLIHGLVVEKYFNPAQEGAINGEGRGWRVENSELRLNSGAGVAVASDGRIVDCDIHHNGQIGATADGTNILLEGNRIWNNNIYGFDPGWDAGGVKITVSNSVVFRRNTVSRNNGPGLWCDESCTNVLFEDNIVEFNQSAGIFFELSSQAVIRGNRLRENNQAGYGWFWGAEIQIAASEGADIHGNTMIVRDGGRAVMLIDQNRWKVGGGFYKTRGNRVHDNDITFLGSGSAGGVSVADKAAENFAIIAKGGNLFERNRYRHRPGQPPAFGWDTQVTDFAGFRRLGQESGGTLTADAAAR